MGNRKFAQVSTSDDEEDDVVPIQRLKPKRQQERNQTNQKKKKKKNDEDDDDDDGDFEDSEDEELEDSEDEDDSEDEAKTKRRNKTTKKKEEEPSRTDEAEGDDDDDEEAGDARPVGDPIKVTGKGKNRRTHYEAFDYDGNQYDLEDPVLITPETSKSKIQKPYVAIIKDVTQDNNGSVMMTGQWFYRPEEAERKVGGNWQSNDTRELFYSFHRDEVPAEAVMHKCVVHFVPLHKQLPNRKQYPGFIVRKVYDTVQRKLWKLTDKDYEDKKQQEIDVLVQKTLKRLVDLPDIEPEENTVDPEEQLKSKRSLRRKNISPIDVSRDDEGARSDQNPKAETPGSCLNTTSEYHSILVNFDVLTGDTTRDRWLERLLQAVQFVCTPGNGTNKDVEGKTGTNDHNKESDIKLSETAKSSQDKSSKDGPGFVWPDAAVIAVTALEKASHDSLFDLQAQKYNQKLRQLVFNLKNNALLTRRLLNGELQPSKILNMAPNELKEGLTAEETAKKEPDESDRMQMTDARCSRCSELKVGLREIIQAGHGDRYQLECIACGYSWYASRDEAASLTIDATSAKNVGTVPLATAKFESIEKNLVSPRESDKDKAAANEILKKTTAAYMPVLETQKSFTKARKDDNPDAPKNAT